VNDQSARIVIIGGGFGGLFTALDLAGAGEVTLISREDHFLFTPMLYEYLSGEVEAWHIAPHYKELLDDRVRFIQGEATDVDFERREVAIAGRGRRLSYDILVIACGGETNYAGVEGAEEHAIPFRKIAHADRLRAQMTDTLDHVPPDDAPQDARRAATFAIVGAGASGVELSTKMAALLQDAFHRRGIPGDPRLLILEMGDRILPGMGGGVREYAEASLHDLRVEVHTRTRVRRITESSIVFEHGGETTEMEIAGVVWTGGVRVNPLVERLELDKSERGLIQVEQTMQTRGRAEVFALGDMAAMENSNVPAKLFGTAQLAFQQSSLVVTNIKNLIRHRPLETKEFVDQGEAVSLGVENAAVLAGKQSFSGPLARQSRFALYTSRLPTWHHRLRVGASWFFEGTTFRPLGERR
jgi:demethylphylloquinone reductase